MKNKTYKKIKLGGWNFYTSKVLRKRVKIFIQRDSEDRFNRHFKKTKNATNKVA